METITTTIIEDLSLFRMLAMIVSIAVFNLLYVLIMKMAMPKLNSIKLKLAYNWFIFAIMCVAIQVPMPTIAIVTTFAGLISLAVVWLREHSKIKLAYKDISLQLEKYKEQEVSTANK